MSLYLDLESVRSPRVARQTCPNVSLHSAVITAHFLKIQNAKSSGRKAMSLLPAQLRFDNRVPVFDPEERSLRLVPLSQLDRMLTSMRSPIHPE